MKTYYQEHAEQFRQKTRDWSAANPEHKRQSQATYRDANRDKLRAWQREHNKTLERRAHFALKTKTRRALKMAGGIAITIEELEAKFAYWNNCCWVCGDPATEIDHVKPLTAGGAHMLCNIRPACRMCNAAKNNFWPLPSRAAIMGII
jgi:5-methylcytosine-specific restriction endonuclease McrA